MAKVRIYELAKEAGVDSKTMVARLNDLGYDVKAHNSTVDEAVADEIRVKIGTAVTKIEEKRIQSKGRPTVILRRKTITVEPVVETPSQEAPLFEETEAPPPSADISAEEAVPVVERAIVAGEGETDIVQKEEPVTGEPIAGPGLVGEEVLEATGEDHEIPSVKRADVFEEKIEPIRAPSAEEGAVPTESPALEAEKAAEPALKKEVVQRRGLAKVIKRAAIQIPVEHEQPKPLKRPEKVRGKVAPLAAKAVAPEAKGEDRRTEEAGLKGKKGKRFVKFHPEPVEREKVRRYGKQKGSAEVDFEEMESIDGRVLAGLRIGRLQRGGQKKQKKTTAAPIIAETKAIKKRIKIFEFISVGDLAHRMGVKSGDVIAKLMGFGVMATVNQALDVETAALVADEFGYEMDKGVTEQQTIEMLEQEESGGEVLPRPPVVTVMGHVDHGKTSILDAIRKTDVAASEAGGITQHIGAHYVRSASGDVVFLDTPGHAAFTAMRSRGAKVTDVVVLVVAADDGVMEQTKEAINHAKAAEVPIVVAINKIDKPDADPMRVMRELSDFGLVPEEWGGQTIYCRTSAKQNLGIEELLDQILLQAEILELKADPHRRAKGHVIEAQLHKGRGPIATVLVQQGSLKVGDYFVVGEFYGKVRSLTNDKGEKVEEAGPSVPVEVQGFSGVPLAGEEFIVVPDEKTAKNVASERQIRKREADLAKTSKISLDNLFDRLQEGEIKELRTVLRADVQGTLEAFGKAMEELSTDAIRLKIIHEGTGAITDSDVLLAAASEAIIIGFNVRPNTKVAELAKNESVDIRFYDVIYHALDDIKKAMAGMLEPTFVERVIGTAEVRQTFHVPKIGTIAGSYVTDGKIERSARVRLLRDGVVVHSGRISSLKRFKDDAREVQTGYECGIGLENFNDIKVHDVLEAFVLDEVKAQL